MSKCLTTLIDTLIDRPKLNAMFSLYEVQLSAEAKYMDFGKRLAKIDKHVEPLGLISHSGNHWVLLNADKKSLENLPDISFSKSSFDSCDDLLIIRLLTRALGKLAGQQVFSGLGETFFYIGSDSFQKQTVHQCVNIDIRQSVRFNSLFINLSGVVFSPLDIVYKPQPMKDKAAKFSFDLNTGLLNRDPKGLLIKHSPGNKHFTSNAVDISGQKTLSLRKSRTGALYHFIQLMNRVFNDAIKINLKKMNAGWRLHYTKSDIQRVYRKIFELVDAAKGIQIVNASMLSDGFEQLRLAKWPVKVAFVGIDDVDEQIPLIVVLDSKEDYETAGKHDPKTRFYSSQRITQSVYNKTILSHKNNSLSVLIDTWVKEIAIKLECTQKRFLIQPFYENLWFVSVEKKRKSDDPVYHILKCQSGEMSFESVDEYYFDDFGVELPRAERFFEDIHYVIHMGEDAPKVCSIIHEGIAAVPDGNKLFPILKNLQKSSAEGMNRDFIIKFIDQLKDSDDSLRQLLTVLCEKYPNKAEFYKEDFKQAGIQYRSKLEKCLFDNYFAATGILLNYSLKGQHNEYLESQTGHFYDEKHSAYFVGMPKGGFKFSRGQFNHIRFIDGPEYLKQKCVEMTASYYVRNKIATVLPFPFKNLAEFVAMK
jgi:hypothetical protein